MLWWPDGRTIAFRFAVSIKKGIRNDLMGWVDCLRWMNEYIYIRN